MASSPEALPAFFFGRPRLPPLVAFGGRPRLPGVDDPDLAADFLGDAAAAFAGRPRPFPAGALAGETDFFLADPEAADFGGRPRPRPLGAAVTLAGDTLLLALADLAGLPRPLLAELLAAADAPAFLAGRPRPRPVPPVAFFLVTPAAFLALPDLGGRPRPRLAPPSALPRDSDRLLGLPSLLRGEADPCGDLL